MLVVVAFASDDKRGIVAGIGERGRHVLVADKPVSGVNVLVVGPILQEHPQRLGLGLADERGVNMAAAQIRIAADEAEHAAKNVGASPGRGEGGDAAGARSGNGDGVRIARQGVLFGHFGQDLIDEEARVAIAQGVVFEAAVEARLPVRGGRRQHAGIDENADGGRHFALVDQIVEDDVRAPAAFVGDEAATILKHHEWRRTARPVLRRDVDPVVADRAGEDFARGPDVFRDLTFRHAGLTLGIRAQDVLLGGLEHRRRQQQDRGWENEFGGHVFSYASSLGGLTTECPILGLALVVHFDL